MSRRVKQKGSIMDNTNKLVKWSFIFCNFYTAADRGAFKRKMKKAGLEMSLLNTHNLIITGANGGARAFILANIPDRATFQELQVTDEEFNNMKNFEGGKA